MPGKFTQKRMGKVKGDWMMYYEVQRLISININLTASGKALLIS